MDSFFGIGILELFFVAIIALIVLGPERLPGTIREVAKYFRMLRNISGEFTSQFSDELKALEEINPQKIIRDITEDPAESKPAAKKTPPTKKKSTAKANRKPKKTTTSVIAAAAKESGKKGADDKTTAPVGTDDVDGDDASVDNAAKAAPAALSETESAASPVTAEDAPAEAGEENQILPPHVGDATADTPQQDQASENQADVTNDDESKDAAENIETPAAHASPSSVSANGARAGSSAEESA